MGKEKSLFSEFSQVSAKQWKQKIQFDLKGADYNETLVWESLEGIQVKPFYHSEDLENVETFSLPKNHVFKIGQFIYAGNPTLANKKALEVLGRGVESLVFQVPDSSIDLAELVQDINTDKVPIQFQFDFMEFEKIQSLLNALEGKNHQIYLNTDLLGNLAKSGNWFIDKARDHQILEELLKLDSSKTNASLFAIDTALFQNAGANMVQQLAYGLCQANEYLNHSEDVISHLSKKPIVFKVAVGSNYFFEIAKTRALRWLWQSLTHAHDIEGNCHILATPSKRNKTLYDYNLNMLRTNTECMAAVLGGADTICNLPYDAIYHKDNEFGERIAKNQLLLLKEESYFSEAANAAEGSYYIETLTRQLAEKALALFKQLEEGGGFLKHLLNGSIQKKIKESAQKEQALFDSGQLISIGTNSYQNQQDRMKDDLELYPFVKIDKRKTVIEPIIEKRLSEKLEIQRLKGEEN